MSDRSGVEFIIDWEWLASSNLLRARAHGHGHAGQYKAAKKGAWIQASNQVDAPHPVFPEGAAVQAMIHFYPPDARRRDVGNLLKCLFDAIEGVVYDNDFQIVTCCYARCEVDRENPRAECSFIARPGEVA